MNVKRIQIMDQMMTPTIIRGRNTVDLASRLASRLARKIQKTTFLWPHTSLWQRRSHQIRSKSIVPQDLLLLWLCWVTQWTNFFVLDFALHLTSLKFATIRLIKLNSWFKKEENLRKISFSSYSPSQTKIMELLNPSLAYEDTNPSQSCNSSEINKSPRNFPKNTKKLFLQNLFR